MRNLAYAALAKYLGFPMMCVIPSHLVRSGSCFSVCFLILGIFWFHKPDALGYAGEYVLYAAKRLDKVLYPLCTVRSYDLCTEVGSREK
jgi:hypothetical protein